MIFYGYFGPHAYVSMKQRGTSVHNYENRAKKKIKQSNFWQKTEQKQSIWTKKTGQNGFFYLKLHKRNKIP